MVKKVSKEGIEEDNELHLKGRVKGMQFDADLVKAADAK